MYGCKTIECMKIKDRAEELGAADGRQQKRSNSKQNRRNSSGVVMETMGVKTNMFPAPQFVAQKGTSNPVEREANIPAMAGHVPGRQCQGWSVMGGVRRLMVRQPSNGVPQTCPGMLAVCRVLWGQPIGTPSSASSCAAVLANLLQWLKTPHPRLNTSRILVRL